jgi:hypothetical protein
MSWFSVLRGPRSGARAATDARTDAPQPLTAENPSATFDQLTVFHHASM